MTLRLRFLFHLQIRTLEADLSRKNSLASNTYDQVRKLQQDVDDARKAVKSLESRNNTLEVSNKSRFSIYHRLSTKIAPKDDFCFRANYRN